MLKLVLIIPPKVPETLYCANGTISLIPRALKLLLKTILQRLRRQSLPRVVDNQFGLVKDRETINANFAIQKQTKVQSNFNKIFIWHIAKYIFNDDRNPLIVNKDFSYNATLLHRFWLG